MLDNRAPLTREGWRLCVPCSPLSNRVYDPFGLLIIPHRPYDRWWRQLKLVCRLSGRANKLAPKMLTRLQGPRAGHQLVPEKVQRRNNSACEFQYSHSERAASSRDYFLTVYVTSASCSGLSLGSAVSGSKGHNW